MDTPFFKNIRKISAILLVGIMLLLSVRLPVFADTPTACPAGQAHPGGDPSSCSPVVKASSCPSGKVDPSDSTKCQPLGNGCANDPNTANGEKNCLSKNPIIKYLKLIINTLAAGVGVVVTAMIILGGIQYSIAGDNSNQVSAAKKRIINAVTALIIFMFIYAFLQWLVPGGVF